MDSNAKCNTRSLLISVEFSLERRNSYDFRRVCAWIGLLEIEKAISVQWSEVLHFALELSRGGERGLSC